MASSPRYARGITRKPVLYGSWMFATNVVGNPPPVTIFGAERRPDLPLRRTRCVNIPRPRLFLLPTGRRLCLGF